MYVIGKTGVGKTGFLKNMALQDINNGQGLAIIDPHGEFVEEVLDAIPAHRINDVVYFNPADMDYPVSFNIMDVADPKYKHLIASGLIGIFTKIWANVWSARMEYILANCILALLDTPGTTLLGIPRMLVDRDYRQKIINNLKDPVVKSFWVNEYEEWESRYRNEAIAPVQNKVGQFLNVSFVRNIVGQSKNTIDIDEIMNNQKILLVNVSKGRIGEDNAAILGAMLITKIQLSAMERVRIPENERKDFYLYVDEFQNFATDSFVNILSEARKYRLDLIIAHQYVGQLVSDTSTAVRDAVFGNVGTMVTFRVGAADAEFLEPEYSPEFVQDDLIRLANRDIYIKLMIDGITSRPFSARTITIAPIEKDAKKHDEIIRATRSRYAHSVKSVEEEINRWAANQEVPTNNTQSPSDFSNPQTFSQPLYKPSNPNNSRASDSTKLYDAVCSNCGKSTKVIFPPEPGRSIYCKSCLKKIHPVKSASPGEAVSREAGQFNRVKSAQLPKPTGQVGKQSEGSSALADLGIEFGPASPSSRSQAPRQENRPTSGPKGYSAPVGKAKTFSLDEIMQKGENVPFNKSRKDKEAQRPPRKSVDLDDLRKTLEQALEKPPTSAKVSVSDKAPAPTAKRGEFAGQASEARKEDVKNSKEELEKRIKEERYEDETLAEANIEAIIPPEEKPQKAKENDKDKKNVIKPGETVKF